MSVQATSWVWKHSEHKGTTLLVFLAVADHMDAEGGGCWTAVETLAEQVRMSPRAVQYAIKELRDSGEMGVARKAGPRGCNLYSIPGMGTQSLRVPSKRSTRKIRNQDAKSADQDAITIAPDPSFEPSIEPSLGSFPPQAETPSQDGTKAQRRTEIKNALVSLARWSPEHMTRTTWKKVEAAAKEADDGGYSADDLRLAALLFRERFPDADLTPHAIIAALPSVPKWQAEPVRKRRAG